MAPERPAPYIRDMSALLLLPLLLVGDPLPITVTTEGERIVVEVDGEPFTALNHGSEGSPYLYPVLGPGGAALTRGYPMDPRPGETKDHPHHRSLWLAHGAVDGYDFWHSGPAAERIALQEVLSTGSGEQGSILARYHWIAGGRVLLEEVRDWRFSADERSRRIDLTTRLRAQGRTVRLGDTKEGTFALRLCRTLRLAGPSAAGAARNAVGDRGREVWGKRASWVAYHGPVPVLGATPIYTVALFDHPSNLRHPTWWHARDYGLVAANPFGIHDFEDAPAGAGDVELLPGEELELRYRVLLRAGEASDAQLDMEGLAFRAQGGGEPPIPTSYRLRVDEDFASASSLERFRFSDPAVWIHDGTEDGSLALVGSSDYSPPHRSPLNIALLSDPLFGSFVLEAEVQQTGREYGHRDLCLFFGFGGPDRYYYVHLASEPDPHAHNVFLVSGAPREALAPVPPEGVDWGSEQWHTVRLTRDLSRGTIRVEFDGRTVLEATDRTHGHGRVGFGSFDDTGRLRRLRVWAEEVRRAPEEADPFARR